MKRTRARECDGLRQHIGDQIRWLRKERGLVQKQLAAMVGVRTSTLGQWETGDRLPGVLCLFRLARALRVPADFFDPEWEDPEEMSVPRPGDLPGR